jgi:heat shock protein HslJ
LSARKLLEIASRIREKSPLKLFSVFLFSFTLFLLASCASHKSDTKIPKDARKPLSLPGSEWQLVDLAGTPVVPGSKPTLAFPDVGRVAGNGSCNRFTGSVTVERDVMKMGPLASTRMACPDNNISKQEDLYLKALQAATHFTYQYPFLSIYAEGFEQPLRFTRLEAGHPE